MTSTPPHCFAVIIILIIRARHDIGKTYTSVEYGNIDIVGVLTFEMFNTIFFSSGRAFTYSTLKNTKSLSHK